MRRAVLGFAAFVGLAGWQPSQPAHADAAAAPAPARPETESPSPRSTTVPTRDLQAPAVTPAPVPASTPATREPLRVAVLSDLNSGYGSVTYTKAVHAATKALIERIDPDLVLITGDMVAGQKAGLSYPAMWRAFHAAVTDPLIAAGVPVAPAPGNHDAAPGFAEERAEYVEQWSDPARVPAVGFVDRTGYPLDYSFEMRGVFFAAIDATAVGPLHVEQRAWLDDQLARARTDATIVFGHLPNHPFAIRRETQILGDSGLEDILRTHAVDAYVSGHHHAYFPGAVDGVRHVAMPCLGAGRRKLIGHAKRSPPGLLVLVIDESGIVSLDALPAPDFDVPVPRHTLPRRITRGRHVVHRDDLADLHPR